VSSVPAATFLKRNGRKEINLHDDEIKLDFTRLLLSKGIKG